MMALCNILTRLSLVLALSLAMQGSCAATDTSDRPLKLSVDLSRPSPQQTASVKCSFEPSLSSMVTVNELRLYGSKPDTKKNDLQHLASVDRWDSDLKQFNGQNVGAFDITGFFGFESNRSELSLSWTLPAQTSGHRYKCAAEGTDRNNQIVTVSELAEITTTAPSVEQNCYATNLEILEDKIDDLAKSSVGFDSNLQKSVEEVENTLNASIEITNTKNLENLHKAVEDISQTVSNKFEEIEATAAERMKTITSFFLGLQDTLKKFQQALTTETSIVKANEAKLATQASVIRAIEARFMFDVSDEFRGKRYLVSKKMEDFKIAAADASCGMYGGYLAELDDKQELNFVIEFLKHIDWSNFYAVGLNDIHQEGSYVFYHSQKAAPANLWILGEPDFQDHEDCVAINPLRGGLLEVSCDYFAKYICEVQF